MAIVQEHFFVNGREFIRTYSDENRCVVRDGISFAEACDPAEYGRTYTEGETIDISEDEYAQAGRIMMGG